GERETDAIALARVASEVCVVRRSGEGAPRGGAEAPRRAVRVRRAAAWRRRSRDARAVRADLARGAVGVHGAFRRRRRRRALAVMRPVTVVMTLAVIIVVAVAVAVMTLAVIAVAAVLRPLLLDGDVARGRVDPLRRRRVVVRGAARRDHRRGG